MKTTNKSNRSVVLAGVAATLAVAALSFAGAAQARDNVFWSVGVGSPGVEVNVGNAQPVYVQPAPVYYQPQPVYVQPAPVYYQPQPVYGMYGAPQPVYYGRPHERHGRHDGYYVQGPRPMYGRGYAPVYYQREGGHDNRRGDRED
jgi:hypothetical protein